MTQSARGLLQTIQIAATACEKGARDFEAAQAVMHCLFWRKERHGCRKKLFRERFIASKVYQPLPCESIIE